MMFPDGCKTEVSIRMGRTMVCGRRSPYGTRRRRRREGLRSIVVSLIPWSSCMLAPGVGWDSLTCVMPGVSTRSVTGPVHPAWQRRRPPAA